MAAAAASALLCGLYAQGGALWPLGFVALLPWLLALDAAPGWRATLLLGLAMTLAFTAAVLPWFGAAIGAFTGIGEPAGFALLLVAAPLLQPQILAFAVVRKLAGKAHGSSLRAGAAAAAWVAVEAFWPKLLGDTLGHGLYPATLLRQSAEYGGTAGLTLALLLANEGLAAAWVRRGAGASVWASPLALAAMAPLLLAAGGWIALQRDEPAAAGPPLRMGLVQSAIVDYERLRREKGAGAVVREVLDLHYAMSYDAVERQRVQAVMWSETVYPTTFGHPKSEAGAELDREIQGIVDAARVPFVFGTYDRDEAGEYNAAAFLAPGRGPVGLYRKARPFPFSEHVPPWLDGPLLRRALPWAGSWLPGSGARVFPLRLADGRELPVLPLICLDDTDPGLAVDGARLGAMLILTMSNDAWFADRPLGAELHGAVAAFRSIETRLPQFRVTSNGISAVIDATGRVLAGSRMGERTLVVGELPVREPRRTLFVAWGDWVGRAGAAFLLLLAAAGAWRARHAGPLEPAATASAAFEAEVFLLPPLLRPAIAALRVLAGAAIAWIAASLLGPEGGWLSPTWTQIRVAAVFVLAPSLVAALLLKAHAARLRVEGPRLAVLRGQARIELDAAEVLAVQAWRLPLPRPGATLRLAGGAAWRWQLAGADPAVLQRALAAAGSAAAPPSPAWAAAHAGARLACRTGWLGSAATKFALLPLALALPAFRLHQQIAFGGPFGEALASGGRAYALGLAGWWAAWAVGVLLVAALLRVAVEAVCATAAWLRPAQAPGVRRALERAGLALLYLGLPAWLGWRVLAA